ncbi:cell envelope-related function transcriptional attenuator common domain-containing protein [Mesobacillus persicus]|uniref:Polyisoprenyl-teichoic acid--peptidoglycan teichoic acid transferase TagU n=1 Tax=Mesobacillus persicus TaxID=930146 RepID=A0A1H8A8M1_9BACI|nr:LytR family transcriptional regulator [Mesobacillus persicus]SEM66178.1 cell envelope-related function transcriptional attenuator common domain-containing protein [Mesobacillus persicus]
MRAERNKKRKWPRIIAIIFLLLIVSIGAYVFNVYRSLTTAVDTMHEPITREREPRPITFEKADPFSVLMLGVDEREGDKGRSDTIIALTVNPKKNSIKMLSIPRDTRTEIIGRNTLDKINHAYAFGGVEMSMDTVENLLDIPIDYYVKVNMEGFQDIVDAVGGIEVNNSFEFTEDKIKFAQGNINLNGEEALAYVRMRKQDPSGDFGRQTRQRQVIQGVINKGVSVGSLTKFDNIFDALGNNVKTNVTFDEMVGIQSNYRSAAGNIEQMKIEASGVYIDGISYQLISEEEQQRIQNELKAHLGITE